MIRCVRSAVVVMEEVGAGGVGDGGELEEVSGGVGGVGVGVGSSCEGGDVGSACGDVVRGIPPVATGTGVEGECAIAVLMSLCFCLFCPLGVRVTSASTTLSKL